MKKAPTIQVAPYRSSNAAIQHATYGPHGLMEEADFVLNLPTFETFKNRYGEIGRDASANLTWLNVYLEISTVYILLLTD